MRAVLDINQRKRRKGWVHILYFLDLYKSAVAQWYIITLSLQRTAKDQDPQRSVAIWVAYKYNTLLYIKFHPVNLIQISV